MSNFLFLQSEFPELQAAANECEAQVLAHPRAACVLARRALELALDWMFDFDSSLERPYENTLAAHLNEYSLRRLMPQPVQTKARLIKEWGNHAVHDKTEITSEKGVAAARELFHVLFWLARTYGRTSKPNDALEFDAQKLPKSAHEVAAQSLEQLQKMAAQLADRDAEVRALREAKQADELQGAALKSELEALQNEFTLAKAEAASTPDAHNYSEAQTRDLFIDLLLREAGWLLSEDVIDNRGTASVSDRTGESRVPSTPVAHARGSSDMYAINKTNVTREYPVSGMPPDRSKNGNGFVDYVLWGEGGLPLAVVEAKKTREDARIGQEQARLYADCLETQFGRRPIIFYTNGYEHWLWDDAKYPPRAVAGFFTRDELERLIARRTTRETLLDANVNTEIIARPYQLEAVAAFAGELQNARRRGLIVMATGTGKTRLAIALCELLSRRGWIKNALFLADRQALVKQTENAFKAHWPDAGVVNLLEDKEGEGRVYVSTYPTMMNLIERLKETPIGATRKFGPGFFDLIIVDEAHRSVYQKYGALFEYFDGLLLGLTATPRGEVARDTYQLFDCLKNAPTFDYGLEEAVREKYLTPPRPIEVPIKFLREGIQYENLSEDDKEFWDEREWNEEGEVPDEVAAPELNAWVFNKDTVDKVLETLMTQGLKVEGGDRLGKTIIFARNREHALFIQKRFDWHYPHLAGKFSRVIECRDPFAQSQLDKFSIKDGDPQIAISIDMLDTGVDVPEVLNLVFFKPVRSRTKFFQMLGRGTRLSPDLLGPGKDKTEFYVFDFCDNFTFFGQNLPEKAASPAKSLSKRLFAHRLELLGDSAQVAKTETPLREEFESLKEEVANTLHAEVAAMNLQNFVVRPHRRQVEKWRERAAWQEYSPEYKEELDEHLAGLPAELPSEDESARQFDLLMLRTQLAVLRSEKAYEKLAHKIRTAAFMLSSTTARNVPMVAAQMELIEDVASEAWWPDVTVPMLENVRKKLRDLVKFIPSRERMIVILDIEDDIGEIATSPNIFQSQSNGDAANAVVNAPTTDYGARLKRVLREQLNHPVVSKLRQNQPLNSAEITTLDELIFQAGGFPDRAEFEKYFGAQPSLTDFTKSTLGLDANAVGAAFSEFLNESSFSAPQIAFVRQIVDYIAQNGGMNVSELFQQPFINYDPTSVVGIFPNQSEKLIGLVNDFRVQ